ncbi:MAG: 3'(2'),5'-bisphosphate nucleotidase CysQ [Pseudomonadota bacterium]
MTAAGDLPLEAWLETLRALAAGAGAAITAVADDRRTERKDDGSPVTKADRLSEAVLLAGLETLVPRLPIVSEERFEAQGDIDTGDAPHWLVDPLDGTKEFAAGGDDYTVNIGLAVGGDAALGVVFVPAERACYFGAVGLGAWKTIAGAPARRIHARAQPADGGVALVSRRHNSAGTTDAFLAERGFGDAERRPLGSSLKFCVLAEGAADAYPRLGPTMEWDACAGHAILAAAGGTMRMADGAPFRYGRPGRKNPSFFASGSAQA